MNTIHRKASSISGECRCELTNSIQFRMQFERSKFYHCFRSNPEWPFYISVVTIRHIHVVNVTWEKKCLWCIYTKRQQINESPKCSLTRGWSTWSFAGNILASPFLLSVWTFSLPFYTFHPNRKTFIFDCRRSLLYR